MRPIRKSRSQHRGNPSAPTPSHLRPNMQTQADCCSAFASICARLFDDVLLPWSAVLNMGFGDDDNADPREAAAPTAREQM